MVQKPTTMDPASNPNLIRVYDAYGRELYISKDDWRFSVLPGALKDQWDDPDRLYQTIIAALTDGFRTDVLRAARHLYAIDPNHGRGATVWGICLLQENRFDEAEAVLRGAIEREGEQGYLLTNLAKVFEGRGEPEKADQTLWHSLELDPNQDNGFAWYWAREKERGGDAAGLAALAKLSTLPNSWLAQVWLARIALEETRVEDAIGLYRIALSHAGNPVPTDLLKQMSGDLGNAGQLAELIALAEPLFLPEIHGLAVGNNLIKAHLDIGEIDAAQAVLEKLYALKRHDYQETLTFWDTAIGEARTKLQQVPDPTTSILMTVPGPVWLPPASEGTDLVPPKASDAILVGILGGTAEMANMPAGPQVQLTDAPGRLSRALPLFFTEQIEFRSNARAETFLVRLEDGVGGGFVLSNVPWTDEDALKFASELKPGVNYLVLVHLRAAGEPWAVDVRLIQVDSGQTIAQLSTGFSLDALEHAIPHIVQQLLDALVETRLVAMLEPPAFYRVPTAHHFGNYLVRLEQLAAVRCSSPSGSECKAFLNNERAIIDGNIKLCVDNPSNITTRLVLAKTLSAMKRVRPDILAEFTDKIAVLRKEKPVSGPWAEVAERLIEDAMAPPA